MVDGESRSESPNDIQPKQTRRSFFGAGATTALGVLASRFLPSPGHHKETPTHTEPTPEPVIPTPATATSEATVAVPTEQPKRVDQEVTETSFHDPFPSLRANEIAREKGITAGNFFAFEDNVVENLSAFRDDELFPIYIPKVLKQKEFIYELADLYKKPPNVIAAIMSIESGGDPQKVSEKNAQGLFQVLPLNFEQVGVPETSEAMLDVNNNAKAAMKVLDFFIEFSAENHKEFSDDDPRIYIRALMGYNGGTEFAKTKNLDEIDQESRLYGDHMTRFMMTAEIAKGLRDDGFSDAEIIKKLSSPEIDARTDALRTFILSRDPYTYDEYSDALTQLSFPIVGENPTTGEVNDLGLEIQHGYNEYKAQPYYNAPASPGARIWIEMGGLGFIDEYDRMHDDNWVTMNSRRS